MRAETSFHAFSSCGMGFASCAEGSGRGQAMSTTTADVETVTEAWPVTLRVLPDDGASVAESIRSAIGEPQSDEVRLDFREIHRITSHQLSARSVSRSNFGCGNNGWF